MRRSVYPNIEKQRKELTYFLCYMSGADHTLQEVTAMTLDLLASFDEKEHVLDVWKEDIRGSLLAQLRKEKGHTYNLPNYELALEEV